MSRDITLCPRWDSNCIPSTESTGRTRKHKESGPIRPLYDPIRIPKCGQCTHLLFDPFDAPPSDLPQPSGLGESCLLTLIPARAATSPRRVDRAWAQRIDQSQACGQIAGWESMSVTALHLLRTSHGPRMEPLMTRALYMGAPAAEDPANFQNNGITIIGVLNLWLGSPGLRESDRDPTKGLGADVFSDRVAGRPSAYAPA
jgi:hypothetical protein